MHDAKGELKVIAELMQELMGKMEYGEEDFDERLGRKKPAVEVVSIEAEPEGEDPLAEFEAEELSPEDKLKDRIMKMRG